MLFNNENEPDLGPVDWSGGRDGLDTYNDWDVSSGKVPKYEFNSEEELIASQVFQRALSKCLEHKDATIRALQQELLNLYEPRN